ncbi:hypothetical protein EV356DRAFT_501426, partial [Viridothelium virens]
MAYAFFLTYVRGFLLQLAAQGAHFEADVLGLPCWLRWFSSICQLDRRTLEAGMALVVPYYAFVVIPLCRFLLARHQVPRVQDVYRESCHAALKLSLLLWFTFISVSPRNAMAG